MPFGEATIHEDAGQWVVRLEGLEGTHMLTVDLESWREKLRGAPWVADATLRRVFPRWRVPPPHVEARPADSAQVVRAT